MTVSDNTIQNESVGDFLKTLGKKGLNVSKKMANEILRNPGRAFDIAANIASAPASRNPKQFLSTSPKLITFYKIGKGLHLGNVV